MIAWRFCCDCPVARASAIGQQASIERPSTHEHLRPRVAPYTYAYNDMGDPSNQLAMRAIQFAMVLLLMVICVNIAILVYARTATRQGEIAVRGALGASRRRIVGQLFVEALTLSGVSALLGLAMVSVAPLPINAPQTIARRPCPSRSRRPIGSQARSRRPRS